MTLAIQSNLVKESRDTCHPIKCLKIVYVIDCDVLRMKCCWIVTIDGERPDVTASGMNTPSNRISVFVHTFGLKNNEELS